MLNSFQFTSGHHYYSATFFWHTSSCSIPFTSSCTRNVQPRPDRQRPQPRWSRTKPCRGCHASSGLGCHHPSAISTNKIFNTLENQYYREYGVCSFVVCVPGTIAATAWISAIALANSDRFSRALRRRSSCCYVPAGGTSSVRREPSSANRKKQLSYVNIDKWCITTTSWNRTAIPANTSCTGIVNHAIIVTIHQNPGMFFMPFSFNRWEYGHNSAGTVTLWRHIHCCVRVCYIRLIRENFIFVYFIQNSAALLTIFLWMIKVSSIENILEINTLSCNAILTMR